MGPEDVDPLVGLGELEAAGGKVVTLDGAPLRYGKTGVAGMRDFENPAFLAAGDPLLLQCFPLDRLAATKAA